METNQSNNDLTKDIVVRCPHCLEPILIEKLNCRIFRHGTLKNNNQQMNPHETKEVCDYFFNNNMIYGCGKPFRIEEKDGEKEEEKGEKDGKKEEEKKNVIFVAVICDYI